MKTILCASLALIGLASAQAQNLEKSLVGAWKVDAKTIKYAPSAKAKEEIAKQKPGAVDSLIKMVGASLAPMTFTFKADHTFMVSGKKPGATTDTVDKGKWTLKGQSVTIKLDKPAPMQPSFTIAKNGKTLQLVQSQANFGTMTIGFVRK
ncbi:MAG: lipocalin family protein [Fimbriimonadaceae bacterium]